MPATASLPEKRFLEAAGARMAYVDVGEGTPVVLLHGNPTSSFLWRDVIEVLRSRYRCIAPDLVGMGDSDRLPGSEYRFVDHRRHLEAFLDRLDPGSGIVLVLHDWGGALGFDWAVRHRDRVGGIAYMETIVAPLAWEDWPEAATGIFRAMRGPAGEEMILDKNVFVERILPASVLDALPGEVMAEYRRPFRDPGEGRRATLTWPREIPIDGEPADVHEIVETYATALASDPVPKLFLNADPGSILVGRQRERCREWPNQEEATVRGVHFVQEDSGEEIGETISAWMARI
jgi:haloalkane dehalogenase